MYFDPDRPIEGIEDDELSRADFAKAVAGQITTAPLDHGFTVAIVGPWGGGKTSVINMVVEQIEGESNDETVVVRYNPWLFRTTGDLLESFFAELSVQAGESTSQTVKRAAGAIAGFGASIASLVPGGTIASPLLFLAADKLNESESVRGRYQSLRTALAEMDRRLVVTVDDIDRLDGGEVRELFRLIRLIADLPNTAYLLAFDRKVVAKQLTMAAIDGDDYLAKIVQVVHELPLPDQRQQNSLIFSALDQVIDSAEALPLDGEAWSEIFYEIVRPTIRTPRDLKRFVNALPVVLRLIGKEVALADLLALEALRANEPRLFALLSDRAEHVARGFASDRILRTAESRAATAQANVSKLLEDAGKIDRRSMAEMVLRTLFPATSEFLGGSSYGESWDAGWRKQRRVASGEVLRIYLQRGLPNDELAVAEVEDVLNALADGERLRELMASTEPERLQKLLERLEDYEGDFEAQFIPSAVPALISQFPRLSPEHPGFFALSPRTWASRILYRLLRKLPDTARPIETLRRALERIDSLSGRFEVIEQVGSREGVGHSLLTKLDAESLEQELIADLMAVDASALAEEWDLVAMCFRVPKWIKQEGEHRALLDRLRQHLDNDQFVVQVLCTGIGTAREMGGEVERRFGWDALEELFGPSFNESVLRVASRRSGLDLDDQDKEAVEIAERYAKGWRPKDPFDL